ncbi:flagellin, partial [Bradyrhizobium sp.]
NNSANKVIKVLNTASSTLRDEASTLGSNLSVVQVRQDFNKNLINVLQTGSSNLTLADTNEEAANSQALSTRQSIAVSALSLANQSQASVLQLLR